MSDVPAHYTDDQVPPLVAATAKMYAFVVLWEITEAVAVFAAQLAEIKRRYEKELSAGPEQFALLLGAAQCPEHALGADPVHSALSRMLLAAETAKALLGRSV